MTVKDHRFLRPARLPVPPLALSKILYKIKPDICAFMILIILK